MANVLDIPLSLYIHIPWCEQKCPYCDFNSHGVKQTIPEAEYISHLCRDLDNDLPYVQGRALSSIFIGGGTPSLFAPEAIAKILAHVRSRIAFADNIEITMEANPGSAEAARFAAFVQAGVNRMSLGIQSFAHEKLNLLGRVHDGDEAHRAINFAKQAGLHTFNTDLMHGLPTQTLDEGLSDLRSAMAYDVPHISWYQLTIEPNTQFASKPPQLPDDDILWGIYERGIAMLAQADYERYEISAYAKPGQQCQHNLNYWRFGDYIGIGCGAHGKITLADEVGDNAIIRTEKIKHPRGYMSLTHDYLYRKAPISVNDRAFEFLINRCRLMESFSLHEMSYRMRTTIPENIIKRLQQAVEQGWMVSRTDEFTMTNLGHRYLNSLLEDCL